MDTIKSIVGLGSSKSENATEPVNGEKGAGTATEPYDGGNKEENPPASTLSGTEPVNGIEGKGTASEPFDAGNEAENPPAPSSIKPEPLEEPLELTEPKGGTAPVSDAVATGASVDTSSKAVVTEPTTTDAKDIEAKPAAHADDVVEPSTTATSASEVPKPAPGASILAAAAVADGTTEESSAPSATKAAEPTTAEAKKSDKRESKIGSVGWFKDTVARRKSKTPTPAAESTGPVETPKEEKPVKDKVVAAVLPEKSQKTESTEAPAPAPASVETEPVVTKTEPVPAPVVETKDEKPVKDKIVAAVVPEKKKSKDEKKIEEPKPKKERSMSRDFKLSKLNPFKRHSKAGLEEKQEKDSKNKKVGEAAGVGAAAGLGTAAVAEETKKEEAPIEPTAPAVLPSETAASNAAIPEETTTPAVATESSAPNHLSTDVPAGAAEPASAVDVQDSKLIEEPTKDVPSAISEPAVEPVKEEAPTESVTAAPPVAEPTAEPASAVAAASTEPLASSAIEPLAPQTKYDDDDVAPDEVAPGVAAPTIVEPTPTESTPVDKGKSIEKAPRNPHGENLNAIPTAGGVRLGEAAYSRRTSVIPPQYKESIQDKPLPPAPLEAETVPEKSLDSETTPVPKTETKAESKKDGIPQRRVSVFDKLKSKLKV